jgi:hypothetical protein
VAIFSVPPDFALDVADRLKRTGATPGERRDAMAVLALVISSLAPQSFASRENATDLAARIDMPPPEFTAATRLLARVGAVAMIQHQRVRRLGVTPDGAVQVGRPREFPASYPMA